MTRRPSRTDLLACVALALVITAAPVRLSPIPSLARALAAENVLIDELALPGSDGTTAKIKRLEITGSNVSADEVRKLLSGGASKDEALALFGRLEATRIAIAELTITPPADKGGPMVVRDFAAEGVSKGKAARISLGGFDGSFIDPNGQSTLKSGQLTVDDVDLTKLLAAAASGDMAKAGGRFSRLSWNGFDLTAPDKDTPKDAPGGNMLRVRLGSLTIDQVYVGDLPQKSTVAVNNLTITMPKASQAGATLSGLGYDKIDTSLRLALSYDPARQSLLLDDLTVSATDFGSLGLRGEFGGIDRSLIANPSADLTKAIATGTLANLDIRLINLGGFPKVVALAAQAGGKTPETVKAEWSAMAGLMLPAMLGGDPTGKKLGDAATRFIADPKSITVTLKGKPGPVPFAELQTLADPAAFLGRVSVDAFAEGGAPTPTPAPVPAPAPQVAAPTPAPAPAPAVAGKLTGLAAWNALIGNTIVGTNTDDAPLFEYYLPNGKVKQSSDGDLATGKWAVKGQKVCFEFGDEDEVCYKLEVVGSKASFIDDDGGVSEYDIVKGNAKGL